MHIATFIAINQYLQLSSDIHGLPLHVFSDQNSAQLQSQPRMFRLIQISGRWSM